MAPAATLEIYVTGASLRCDACYSTADIKVSTDQREWRDRLNLWAVSHRMPRIVEVHTSAGTWRCRD